MSISSTEELALQVRRDIVRMVHRARASHVGSALSVVDILAVLYGAVMSHRPDDPRWAGRDRLILSKGHAAAAGYAVLARTGYFHPDVLDTYLENGSPLAGHLTASAEIGGVEISTGSLGHGLSVASGMALWARRMGSSHRIFAILSDGECQEGTTWEAALFAAHHALDALCVVVDFNAIQSFGRIDEVMGLEPIAEKWRAFGWSVAEVDGHDHATLLAELRNRPQGRPRVVIARTIKGKGVSFMEDELAWHYRSPDDAQVEAALAELSSTR